MIEVAVENSIGFLTLNRLNAYNALSADMIMTLLNTLKKWEKDHSIKAVVIRSSSTEVFCAGGDIKALYTARHAPIDERMLFFYHEYQLDYLLNVYPKPILSFLNGLTMGGGVGIGMHNRFVIAAEQVVFAMPETAIGLFPDIGSSAILNTLPNAWRNAIGVFGMRLTLTELLGFGLVDVYIPVADWQACLQALQKLVWSHDAFEDINGLLQQFNQPHHLPLNPPCFQFSRLDCEQFADMMKNIDEAQTDYFQQLKTTIQTLSPLSMAVTFEKLKKSQTMNLAQCLALDYQLLYPFLKDSDFFEGVRALLIDKDKRPRWKYSHWDEIPEAVIQSYFTPKVHLNLK